MRAVLHDRLSDSFRITIVASLVAPAAPVAPWTTKTACATAATPNRRVQGIARRNTVAKREEHDAANA